MLGRELFFFPISAFILILEISQQKSQAVGQTMFPRYLYRREREKLCQKSCWRVESMSQFSLYKFDIRTRVCISMSLLFKSTLVSTRLEGNF